jgi:hypothetical protein
MLASAVSMNVAGPALQWATLIAKTLASTEKITIIAPVDPRINDRPLAMTLADDITVQDLIPDHTWQTVRAMLPEWKRRGVATDIRNIVATIIAHEIYGCSWPKSAKFGGKWQTARDRLAEWKDNGIWESVKAEILRSGISQEEIALQIERE